ncbi:MAG TPA: hypothetical protein VI776_07255 [Anaerolineales bacterium]|nr:hypothetical protein [Anaerolineales bacterium]
MAEVLSLIDRGATITAQLNAPAAGNGNWSTRLGGWQTAPGPGGLVTETLQLFASGTDAQMTSSINKIDLLIQMMRDYFANPLARYDQSVWLHQNAAAESPKRSLVYNILFQPAQELTFTPHLGRASVPYTLVLERHPLWENNAASTYSGSAISCFGGTWQPSVDTGSEDGRIEKFEVRGRSGFTTPLRRIWLGIKPTYSGLTGFDPTWELEHGSVYNGATKTAVTGASGAGNNCVRVTSVASTLTKYAGITVANHVAAVGGESYAYAGKFLILCRCKLDAGTVALRMYQGITASASLGAYVPSEPVYISNTNWRLIELGVVQFPFFGRKDVDGWLYLDYEEIHIYAEQVSGTTAALDLDALVLIPAERMAIAKNTNTFYGSVSDLRPTSFLTHETEETQCLNYYGTIPILRPEATIQNFFYPIDGGIFVLSAERDASHELGDQVDAALWVYPRWRSIRAT